MSASPFAFAADCPLCDFAYKNDVAEVKRLLANDADVNAKNIAGYTPLFSATAEIAEVLLANGAKDHASVRKEIEEEEQLRILLG